MTDTDTNAGSLLRDLWQCGCGQTNAGWAPYCGRCATRREGDDMTDDTGNPLPGTRAAFAAPEDGRHLGILCVSGELLIQALALPPGTVIHDVRRNFEQSNVVIEFRVEQDELPIVKLGNVIPKVTAVIGHRRNDQPVFLRWSA